MSIDPKKADQQAKGGRCGNCLIEVFAGSSLRDFRLSILALAMRLSEDDAHCLSGLVVLTKTRISPASLERERSRMAAVMRPDLLIRMAVLNSDAGIDELLARADTPADLRDSGVLAYISRLLNQHTGYTRPYGSIPGSG